MFLKLVILFAVFLALAAARPQYFSGYSGYPGYYGYSGYSPVSYSSYGGYSPYTYGYGYY